MDLWWIAFWGLVAVLEMTLKIGLLVSASSVVWVMPFELWAIMTGLNLVVENYNNKKIIVETDSQQAIDRIMNTTTTYHPFASLILNYKFLLTKISDHKITKINRHQNKLADTSTKKGRMEHFSSLLSIWISMFLRCQLPWITYFVAVLIFLIIVLWILPAFFLLFLELSFSFFPLCGFSVIIFLVLILFLSFPM